MCFLPSRQRASRGAAASEFALVMPAFFALVGMTLVAGLGALGRLQMMDMVHVAVRSCAGRVDTVQNVSTFNACVRTNLQANLPNFQRVCTLAAPTVSAATSLRQTPPYPFGISATLSCPFQIGLPLLAPLGFKPKSFAVQATATAPVLPRYPP